MDTQRSFKATELQRGSWLVELQSGERLGFSNITDMLGFLHNEFGLTPERMAEKLAPASMVELRPIERERAGWFNKSARRG